MTLGDEFPDLLLTARIVVDGKCHQLLKPHAVLLVDIH